jgi:hypothetical protein
MVGRLSGWMIEWLEGWMLGWMFGWIVEWWTGLSLDYKMVGWLDGWILSCIWKTGTVEWLDRHSVYLRVLFL